MPLHLPKFSKIHKILKMLYVNCLTTSLTSQCNSFHSKSLLFPFPTPATFLWIFFCKRLSRTQYDNFNRKKNAICLIFFSIFFWMHYDNHSLLSSYHHHHHRCQLFLWQKKMEYRKCTPRVLFSFLNSKALKTRTLHTSSHEIEMAVLTNDACYNFYYNIF